MKQLAFALSAMVSFVMAISVHAVDLVFLGELVEIPSSSVDYPQVNRAMDAMKAYLEKRGVWCAVETCPKDGRKALTIEWWEGVKNQPKVPKEFLYRTNKGLFPASAANDAAKTIESAKRGFGLSKLASDQLRLAWAYEKAGKPVEAAAEYAQVAERYPGTSEAAEAMYRKAMIDARDANWSAAELALAEALSGDKLGAHRAEALYWRGVAAMNLGHETEGAAFLEQAVEAGLGLDEAREAKLMVADCDYRAGRLARATSAYRNLVREGACERMSAARVLAVGKLLDGEEAETCARTLTKNAAAEWRQAGWALLGALEEKREAYAAAIGSYRKCLAEKAKTEEMSAAALCLGRLEFRAGEREAADRTLKKAIELNAADARARAEAYLLLAKNAGAQGDWKSACAYATVVTSLFDDAALCAEAKKILEEHAQEKE